MDHDQEREIVASVLKGDREAYKTSVFNLAYRMTGSLVVITEN